MTSPCSRILPLLLFGAAFPLSGLERPAQAASDGGPRAGGLAQHAPAAPVLRLAEAKGKAKQQAPTAQAAPSPEETAIRTETITQGQWTVTCRQVGSQPKSCSAVLRVVQAPNQQVVLLWEISRGADGAVQTTLQTPTGVFVQKGVDLKIGNDTVGKLDYFACVPQNCEASGNIDDALGTKLAAATEVTVTVHAKDGRDVNFKFPVKGIDKALEAVRT